MKYRDNCKSCLMAIKVRGDWGWAHGIETRLEKEASSCKNRKMPKTRVNFKTPEREKEF